MKEIKFRAWDKENKKFNYFDLTDLWHDMADGNCDDETMQYTGLKDKNGKEIYEGDIVKIDNDTIQEISYWTERKYMKNIKQKIREFIGIYQAFIKQRKVEVVGNIYENPEDLTP